MKNLSYQNIKLVILFIWFACPYFANGQDKIVTKYENQKELTASSSITFKDGFTVSAGADFKAYINTSGGIPVNTIIDPLWNTITTYNVRVPGIIDPADPQNGVNHVNVEVQTLDHFGRLIETQGVKATPTFQDIIKLNKYDAEGKEYKKYLPYAYPSGLKNFHGEGYVLRVGTYYNGTTKTPSIATNTSPESQTVFDKSPLNRVLEVSAPGADFNIASGHTVKTMLQSSAGDVAKYKVSMNATTGTRKLFRDTYDQFYGGLDVSMVSIKNENVAGLNGMMYEMKNKEGQMIVKRQYLNDASSSYTDVLSTYYVYDDLGNLCFVLPPKSNPDGMANINQAALDSLCYQYNYDSQQRMIAKKIPGKGWEYMVYNKLNQVVMTQDSVQRMKTPQEWNFTKYDGLGRVIHTGIFAHAGSIAGTKKLSEIQGNVDAQAKQWETRVTTGNGYTSKTFPNSSLTTLLLNYYDDYNFPGGNPYPYTGTDACNMTNGLLTGNKTAILGSTSNMLWSVNYYDRDGRTVRVFKQHYKGNAAVAGNYDEISSTYDFSGAILTNTRSHKLAGAEQLKVINEYSYDHMGRKFNSWQTTGNGSKVLLSQVEYDDLGHVYKKKLHSTNSGSSFLQTVTYAYNERDWLTSAAAPLLDMKIRYNTPEEGATPQYNGNISEVEYTGLNSGNRWFKYTYDGLSRLTNSEYSNANQLSEQITYDWMGNITSLKRGATTNDPVTYYYPNNSNRLIRVSGIGGSGTFSYDGNGNVLYDHIRGVNLTYNQLNLPATVSTSKSATYTYDAAGTKLKSVQGAITRDYISGIQYTDGAIDFVTTQEGRAVRKSDGTYRYEYNLTDNLGNVRVSFDDNDGAGTARVIQEDEYYAFGLNRNVHTFGAKNNYLYNGKEEQDALTDIYDYGARFYDPVIGRWTTVDPSADEADQESDSPYSYVFNNPVKNTDPDGRIPTTDPPSAKTLIKGAAITTGGVAGGIFAASLATGGIVAAGGTATIVGAPVGWVVGGGIIAGGAATAGIMWLADKISERIVRSNNASSENAGRRAGQPFTPKEKEKVIDANKQKNDGKVICEGCKVETTKPEKSQRGVTPPSTDRQVDHIDPKSNGGSGTAENGQVLCRTCNIDKSNKIPEKKKP